MIRPAKTGCSFERIYFSRGNDPDIYAERKMLGALLVPDVLKSVGNDFSNSVFSYVPNTAESAYYGFMEQLRLVRRAEVQQQLIDAKNQGELTDELINELVMDNWPKGEKIANKDIKLRTFISQESGAISLFLMFMILPMVWCGRKLMHLSVLMIRLFGEPHLSKAF